METDPNLVQQIRIRAHRMVLKMNNHRAAELVIRRELMVRRKILKMGNLRNREIRLKMPVHSLHRRRSHNLRLRVELLRRIVRVLRVKVLSRGNPSKDNLRIVRVLRVKTLKTLSKDNLKTVNRAEPLINIL